MVLCDVIDMSYYIYIYSYIHMLFVFQGSPGLQGSQGHPGDEGTSVSVKCLTSSSLSFKHLFLASKIAVTPSFTLIS